jgi:hypothetical protein
MRDCGRSAIRSDPPKQKEFKRGENRLNWEADVSDPFLSPGLFISIATLII